MEHEHGKVYRIKGTVVRGYNYAHLGINYKSTCDLDSIFTLTVAVEYRPVARVIKKRMFVSWLTICPLLAANLCNGAVSVGVNN